MVDVITAVREILKHDPDVNLMTGGRVFGGELPPTEVEHMPRKTVVVMYAGGDPRRGTTPVAGARLVVWSWAESFHEAGRLDAAVFDVLENVIRRTVGNVLVHAILPIGAPSMFKDADAGWPAYARSASVIIDQRTIEEVE